MQDTLTMEVRTLRREIAELTAKLAISDIVNKKEAMEILDISSKTLTNYVGQGKIRVVSRNGAGQPFFSRRQLLGYEK